jgi:hypothetical protein
VEIWKFRLEAASESAILMPKGAKLLNVQDQQGVACVWALIDPLESMQVNRKIYVVGTGWPLKPAIVSMPYIGTFQQDDGRLVFHAFDGGEA